MTEEGLTKKYLLDTNVLVELDRWIPSDLNPEFWTTLEEALGEGKWVLLDIVVKEIIHPKPLVAWCQRQKSKGYVSKVEDAQKERGVEINTSYPMIDEVTRRSETDTYLIAYAETYNLIVFSREGKRKLSEILLKIPDVCLALGIPFIREPREFYEHIGAASTVSI